jgi:hypothetical protein
LRAGESDLSLRSGLSTLVGSSLELGRTRSGRLVCSVRSVRSGLAVWSLGVLSSVVEGLSTIRAGGRCPSFVSVLEGTSALGDVRPVLTGRSFVSEVRFTSRSSFPESTWRIGRATAPVGRVSIVPAAPEVVTGRSGRAGLASRPPKTRDLRSSPSSATPGVRVAAPVGLSCNSVVGFTLAGRAIVMGEVRSPAVVRSFKAYAGRTGRSVRSGSLPITRRANTESAGLSRAPSAPKFCAAREVTARR